MFAFYVGTEKRIRYLFKGFSECMATTGKALTDSLLENLRVKEVEKIRGQGNDGAANTAGKKRGVNASISGYW